MKKSTPPATSIDRTKKRSAFNRTLEQAQTHMSPLQRRFSRVIHVRTLERVSDALSYTIARPLPLICGSLSLIIIAGGMYLAAKQYGYALSGLEPILAFGLGWIVGITIDYTRLLIRGHRSHH